MENIAQFLNRLGIARVAAMGVVAVLMLGFFAFLVMRASTPQMAPLYSGLSFEDSSAIVSQLQSSGIAYELRGDGDTILVPRDQITTTRMTLAQNGLPTRGQVGYEIFDQQNTLGATSFVQNINNVRALEGELARTISSLARIKSARVHLVLPERELFQRDKKDPTASIVLAVRGELSTSEIKAIQHLVASAIQGLSPNRVSIVDGSGRLLASGAGDDASILTGEVTELQIGIESRMQTRLEDLLSNIVGNGRARVQVSAELNTDRSTKTSEQFDPNGQVVRSTQTNDNSSLATGLAGDGQVSVSNELPGSTQTNNSAGSTADQSKSLQETTNYEISKTTETAVSEAGSLKRLSVAVVVDGTYTTDANGNAVYTPRPQAEIDQITALVKSSMGFDQVRGDQLQVVNMQFASPPGVNEPGNGEPGLFDFTRDDLINFAQMAVTLLIALALVLFVMRPLVRKVLAPEPKPLALPASAEVNAEGQPLLPADEAAAAQAMALAEGAVGPDGQPTWMTNAKSLGEAHYQTLKTVGELVHDNPKQAATIVRDWLTNAA